MLNSWRGPARFLAAVENNRLTVTVLQFFCFLFSSLHDPVQLQISCHHLCFVQAVSFTGFIKDSK